MAYQFTNEASASFKVQEQESGKYTTLKGINANQASAQIICNGVASLLAIGGIFGVYDNASRVVTENVYDDENS